TVWVGGETLEEYFRLQINPDGAGLLTAQWLVGKAARAYTVTGTTLSNRRITFHLESADDRSESLYLGGMAWRGLLQLQVGSNSPKFEQDITLQPQAQLIERLKAVTQRAEKYEARNQPR